MYQDLGIEYKTPFVGLIIFSPDYLKMVKDLRRYLSIPLEFTSNPKYKKVDYPVGVLDDIEIYFMHYKDENEALEKWNRRLQRINWDNIFIKINDRDLCSKQILKEFDELKLNKKVIFTAHEHEDLRNYVWFKEYSDLKFVEPELKSYKKYFDVVDWLNGGGDSIQ